MALIDSGMCNTGGGAVQTEYWGEESRAPQGDSWWGQSSWFKSTEEPTEVLGVEVTKSNWEQKEAKSTNVVTDAPGNAASYNRFVQTVVKEPVKYTGKRRKFKLAGLEGLRSDVLSAIRDYVVVPLQNNTLYRTLGVRPSTGVLLTGTTGTGKSLVQEALTKSLKGVRFCKISAVSLATQPSPKEELVKIFENAIERAPSLIIIDDISLITATTGRKPLADLTFALCTQMDHLTRKLEAGTCEPVIVMASSEFPAELPESLQAHGRLERLIQLHPPTEDGRLRILKLQCKDFVLGEDVNLRAIARDSRGFNGGDLQAVCRAAGLNAVTERLGCLGQYENEVGKYVCDVSIPLDLDMKKEDKIEICMDHFVQALEDTTPGDLGAEAASTPTSKVLWEDVGGANKPKRLLLEAMQWPLLYPKLFQKYGKAGQIDGIILVGPPGCGKTLLAEAIANECKANFITIAGPQLLAPYFGESEANVRAVFAKARAHAPCVLFFDQLEAIGRTRSESGNSTGARVLNQLLAELDGVGSASSEPVLVLAASNRPELIDPALMRPGRFGQIVHVKLPNKNARLAILKTLLRNTPLHHSVTDEDHKLLQTLAEDTKGLSGADLSLLCNQARTAAINRIIARKESEDGALPADAVDKAKELGDDDTVTSSDLLEARKGVQASVMPQHQAPIETFLAGNNSGNTPAAANAPAQKSLSR